ncbi:MAG: FAD/NAD(P)-binding protein [Dehalococcoidales bacterium]|nr:FAD/NAD(P)-binding protein [Dehalococcoidales bacterium]
MNNPYLPSPMRIEGIVTETEDRNIKTFSLSFLDRGNEAVFKYIPGQFAELSVLGKGEAPFGIASSPTQKGIIEFTVNKIGLLTTALHNMEPGETVGIRGPLGNGYPLTTLQDKNVVIIGGGFGFSTLRALTTFLLDKSNRNSFNNITVIYGARSPGLLLYKDELREWEKRADLQLYVTVDKGDKDWEGRVGFIPAITKEIAPRADNAYVLVCGPPAMIRFTLPVIEELGFPPERTLLSLEMRMKCGLGKCGRCNIGSKYVCRDGPVFTLAELNRLPREY